MKMKSLSIIASILFAGFAFSAQFSWDAGYFNSSFDDGTCYLIQMTSGTATIADIANYINTNGLSYSGSDFKVISTQMMDSDLYGAFAEGGLSGLIDAGNYTNLFVLALTQDQAKYALSPDFTSITVNDVQPGYLDVGGWVEGAFDSVTGTVGGTTPPAPGPTPGVPEPTALALLALGVAGLALRRRA